VAPRLAGAVLAPVKVESLALGIQPFRGNWQRAYDEAPAAISRANWEKASRQFPEGRNRSTGPLRRGRVAATGPYYPWTVLLLLTGGGQRERVAVTDLQAEELPDFLRRPTKEIRVFLSPRRSPPPPSPFGPSLAPGIFIYFPFAFFPGAFSLCTGVFRLLLLLRCCCCCSASSQFEFLAFC
jgi:hypothetical protein